MIRAELRELIANGESSGVAFKDRSFRSEELVSQVVALANFQGGRVLLGVDDDGYVCGLARDDSLACTEVHDTKPYAYQRLKDWVSQICRDSIRPAIVPYFDVFHDVVPNRDVAVVQVERGWNIHHFLQDRHRRYYLRVGTLNRETNPEDLAHRFPQRGALRPELRPVSGTSIADLDQRRLTDYFERVYGRDVPEFQPSETWRENTAAWARGGDGHHWRELVEYREKEWYETREAERTSLLVNAGFLYESDRRPATVAGLVLFGKSPSRFLSHARIEAAAYCGPETDCALRERRTLHGPVVRLDGVDGTVLEPGLVELAVQFVRRNTGTATLEEGVPRRERWSYPEEAVREVIVNAIMHRDYLFWDSAVELNVYSDRLEVVSPGRLVNGITSKKVRSGCRSARNELLKDVMRDYEYPKHGGMGVPGKILRKMKEHNGTEPGLIEEEDRLVVQLWKYPCS